MDVGAPFFVGHGGLGIVGGDGVNAVAGGIAIPGVSADGDLAEELDKEEVEPGEAEAIAGTGNFYGHWDFSKVARSR